MITIYLVIRGSHVTFSKWRFAVRVRVFFSFTYFCNLYGWLPTLNVVYLIQLIWRISAMSLIFHLTTFLQRFRHVFFPWPAFCLVFQMFRTCGSILMLIFEYVMWPCISHLTHRPQINNVPPLLLQVVSSLILK